MLEVNCILYIDSNNSMPENNAIPQNKEYLLYFNNITTQNDFINSKNSVIMDNYIGKELDNMYNYILSPEHNNLQDIFQDIKTKNTNKIFIMGGKKLYEHFINNNLVKYIYITKIDGDFDSDLYLNLNLNNYKIVNNTQKEIENHILNFQKYENKNYVSPQYWTYVDNMPFCNFEEVQYLEIMNKIINTGHYRQTRNANTFSIFGCHMYFNLENNTLPLLTTKKMFTRGIIEELIFFLKGETNSKLLEEKKVNIWKPNTTRDFLDNNNLQHYKEGDMGPMYGFQWRHFNAEYSGCDSNYENKGIDQLQEVIQDLKTNKYSRRILMTTYNPLQVKQGVLYPCHGLVVQFGFEDDNKLCCHMYQRSADYALGVPFNITSYAFLVHILCTLLNNNSETQITAGKLYMSFGDVHLYENHIETAKLQLLKTPFLFPKLKIKNMHLLQNINALQLLKAEDFEIINYNSNEKLNYEMVA